MYVCEPRRMCMRKEMCTHEKRGMHQWGRLIACVCVCVCVYVCGPRVFASVCVGHIWLYVCVAHICTCVCVTHIFCMYVCMYDPHVNVHKCVRPAFICGVCLWVCVCDICDCMCVWPTSVRMCVWPTLFVCMYVCVCTPHLCVRIYIAHFCV